jgi:SET domain-containing protein
MFPSTPETEEEIHIRKNFVEVRPSNIPGGGRGVFAKKPIAKGEWLGYYRGTIVKLSDLENTDYALTLEDGTVVCGRKNGNFVSIINCYLGSGKPNNVEFRSDGKLFATMDIRANDELLTNYGKDYWINRPEMMYEILTRTPKAASRMTRKRQQPKHSI